MDSPNGISLCWAYMSAIIAPIAAVIVAGFVAVISFLQWRINREKLRLDLYNRRFDIYARILDIYDELLQWKDSPEQEALKKPFFKAAREAKFMFPKDSGVYEYIQEFHTHAFYVVTFAKTHAMFVSTSKESVAHVHERVEHVNWILVSITELERRMSPYLRFDRL